MPNETQTRILVLGSTGSIGRQALDVIKSYPDRFKVVGLTAQNNAEVILQQAIAFNVPYIYLADNNLQNSNSSVQIVSRLEELFERAQPDLVINAIVGFAGLKPSLLTIEHGAKLALANKETLVIAGELVEAMLKQSKSQLVPIDSEHSAVLQCLQGEQYKNIAQIILTASGGPFRELPVTNFKSITPEMALNHPNWEMGNRITIDSATLLNKGLEVIEAYWLFNVAKDKIKVLVHPQSVIHSMVEFMDGSIKAQLGYPDMKTPIRYALSYPDRFDNCIPSFDFSDIRLTFYEPDDTKFPCLKIARQALAAGGSAPCVLNAADEIAVHGFLNKAIRFTQIPEVIEASLNHFHVEQVANFDHYYDIDTNVRSYSSKWIKDHEI